MKNKKLTMVASVILVIAMLLGTMTAAATDLEITTTTEAAAEATTEAAEETTTEPAEESTTAPTEETTTEVAGETTTVPADETTTEPTTGNDSYYDDSEYESEEEKEAYDDGYDDGEWEGYYDGYDDGYYEGYYEAMNGKQNEIITIFDRWDAFREDRMERIEEFIYRIKDFFQRLFRKGPYEPYEPVEPDDTDFIPDGSQATLEGDETAAALCDEFNILINRFVEEAPEEVTITKIEDVGAEITDCPGGKMVENIVQPILDSFTGSWSDSYYCDEGDLAYFVQETYLMPEYLTAAEKTVNEDGTTDYKFVIMEEAAYYDGYETCGVRIDDGELFYYTLQHELAADALYIEYADVEPATITYAEIVYPGATVTATTDSQGRLVKYDINMPVKGTGKVSFITVTIGLEDYRNEGFVMEYEN